VRAFQASAGDRIAEKIDEDTKTRSFAEQEFLRGVVAIELNRRPRRRPTGIL